MKTPSFTKEQIDYLSSPRFRLKVNGKRQGRKDLDFQVGENTVTELVAVLRDENGRCHACTVKAHKECSTCELTHCSRRHDCQNETGSCTVMHMTNT